MSNAVNRAVPIADVIGNIILFLVQKYFDTKCDTVVLQHDKQYNIDKKLSANLSTKDRNG